MLYTTDDWLGPQVINEFLATYFHMTVSHFTLFPPLFCLMNLCFY